MMDIALLLLVRSIVSFVDGGGFQWIGGRWACLETQIWQESLLVGGDDAGPSRLRKDACRMGRSHAASKSD